MYSGQVCLILAEQQDTVQHMHTLGDVYHIKLPIATHVVLLALASASIYPAEASTFAGGQQTNDNRGGVY